MKLDRISKSTNIKLYKNPSSGNRVVPRGQMDRRTNNFENAPKSRLPLLGIELISSFDHP